jgi:hypothetical protein
MRKATFKNELYILYRMGVRKRTQCTLNAKGEEQARKKKAHSSGTSHGSYLVFNRIL